MKFIHVALVLAFTVGFSPQSFAEKKIVYEEFKDRFQMTYCEWMTREFDDVMVAFALNFYSGKLLGLRKPENYFAELNDGANIILKKVEQFSTIKIAACQGQY